MKARETSEGRDCARTRFLLLPRGLPQTPPRERGPTPNSMRAAHFQAVTDDCAPLFSPQSGVGPLSLRRNSHQTASSHRAARDQLGRRTSQFLTVPAASPQHCADRAWAPDEKRNRGAMRVAARRVGRGPRQGDAQQDQSLAETRELALPSGRVGPTRGRCGVAT